MNRLLESQTLIPILPDLNRSSSWGLNEHTNGLIRRFLPKGTDFNEVSNEGIAKIEYILNTRE
ncbi:hypothetical protein [Candidatus Enterovibrio escicola]|uniref:hypothetical protein n=1 Tax=Candidatus Enterovibrio escicola TaxID=1927127 RepID=UPI001237A35C|nr:hypothetical protein [Candidatus Enterovibrio escacola]